LRNYLSEGSYWRQDCKKTELLFGIIKSIAYPVLAGWLFYRSIWGIIALIPFGLWQFFRFRKNLTEKKKQEFLKMFREMMLTLSSLLNTGYSVENALKEAGKELGLMFGKKSKIMVELAIMRQKLRVRVPAEQVLQEFADNTDMEDVSNFVTIFAAAKRSGGDMCAIIGDSVKQISDKMDVKREIATVLAAKQYEFQVMTWVPFGIIGYMSLSFPEFMSSLYGNILGIGVMTLCFVLYISAYWLGLKIINIEV
jgi:tight adherence protein B